MITIFVRTLVVYVVLIGVMRMMGKRQIGELEVTDLVTTLLISEIASLPITNVDLPVLHAILPILMLLVLEILSSCLLISFPKLKCFVSASPTVIIQEGVLRQKALRQLRISMEELMSEIRQAGYVDIAQIRYAILEKNGKLTVLPKAPYAQPTLQDLGISPKADALMHIVYCNNSYSEKGLGLIGKDRAWLDKELKKKKLDVLTLFCVTADKDGNLFWIAKEDT